MIDPRAQSPSHGTSAGNTKRQVCKALMTIEAPESGSGTENAPGTAKRPINCSEKFGDSDPGGDSTDGDRTSLLLLGLVIIGPINWRSKDLD